MNPLARARNYIFIARRIYDRCFGHDIVFPAPVNVGPPNVPIKRYHISGSVQGNSWDIEITHPACLDPKFAFPGRVQTQTLGEPLLVQVDPRQVSDGMLQSNITTREMLAFARNAVSDVELNPRERRMARQELARFEKKYRSLLRTRAFG